MAGHTEARKHYVRRISPHVIRVIAEGQRGRRRVKLGE